MTDAYFNAFRAGQTAAIEAMIDFYGGAGTFAGWPQKVRDYAIATTPVNMLDWMCAYSFHLTGASLARIEVPTLVMCGATSHPAMKRATELLAGNLANGRMAMVEGAAHFMISTHAGAVAEEVQRHVSACQALASGLLGQSPKGTGESARQL